MCLARTEDGCSALFQAFTNLHLSESPLNQFCKYDDWAKHENFGEDEDLTTIREDNPVDNGAG